MRFLICFMFALIAAVPGVRAGAAVFPVLDAPAMYGGEAARNDTAIRVLLRLKSDGLFVLYEKWLTEDNVQEVTLTGSWRQVADGALLELSNRNGFLLALNVGGSGNLYLGKSLVSGEYVTLVLKPQEETLFPYRFMGILHFGGQKSLAGRGSGVLEDSNTGIVYQVRGIPDALQERHRGKPLFVEVQVREDPASETLPVLNITRIISATETIPKTLRKR